MLRLVFGLLMFVENLPFVHVCKIVQKLIRIAVEKRQTILFTQLVFWPIVSICDTHFAEAFLNLSYRSN